MGKAKSVGEEKEGETHEERVKRPVHGNIYDNMQFFNVNRCDNKNSESLTLLLTAYLDLM